MSGIAIWREPSAFGVVVFGACAITGALLVALPDYFRYYAALREAPPLPDRVEEAFDETYRNLLEMRGALERLGEAVASQDKQSRDRETVSGEPDSQWKAEMEEALTRLRIDCDAVEDRLRPILPTEEGGPPRNLPAGMLAKALSGAGKGKGFPLSGHRGDG